MNIFSKLGEMFSPGARNVPRDAGSALVPSAKFLNENRGGNILQGMQPVLRSSSSDVRAGWERAAAHAVDVIQNSGYIAGMVDAYVNELVGTGPDLNITPNPTFLGMTEEGAWQWAAELEDRFYYWANRARECDLEDRSSFYKFIAQQVRAHVYFGETFTHMAWQKRFGSTYGTKFKAIPAYAVANKSNGSDVVHGVKINEAGAALGYHFRKKSEHENALREDVYIAKRDRFGRPQVIHSFDGMPGQLRGITPLAPALQIVRQFDRLQDTTLAAATLQTIYAATITSDLPSADVLQLLTAMDENGKQVNGLEAWFSAQTGFAKNVDINLGHNSIKIPHLMPNERFDIKQPGHPGGNYVDFAKFLLMEIARCLGLTYYSATGDASNSNYATLNVGEAKNQKLFDARRQNIVAPHCDEIFEAFLEEDIQEGYTKFPGGHAGYLANRHKAFTTQWRGPGKPKADDLKAAKAMEILDGLGVVSQTEMAAELGFDIAAEYKKRAREQRLRKALGLREPIKQRIPDVEEQQLLNAPEERQAA